MVVQNINPIGVKNPNTGHPLAVQQCQNPIGGGVAHNVPSFKAQQANLNQHDIVEISAKQKIKKKQRFSKAEKWALGIGGTIVGLAALKFGANQYFKYLFNKKAALSNLPQNINFIEAKTKDEALKFIRDTLKISNIDENISLDVLNYINKGLVDFSNANKGKCFMPTSIKYSDDLGNGILGIQTLITSKNFGGLEINKKFYSPENIDKLLQSEFFINGDITKPFFKFNEKGELIKTTRMGIYKMLPNKSNQELLNKYYKNPKAISFSEKMKLYETNAGLNDFYYHAKNTNIMDTIKRLLDKSTNLAEKKKNINLEELGKKSFKEQEKFLTELEEIMLKNKEHVDLIVPTRNELYSVYHEMGHLQDMFKNRDAYLPSNLKTLRNKLNILPSNDHKEFLTNSEIRRIVGSVSEYSLTHRDEFIAEVYAGLLSGRKYSDEVMNLYKKYNGPLLG